MTAEEVRQIVDAFVDVKVLPSSYIMALWLLGSAVVGGLVAWVGAYLGVKAKNFATSEDLNRLTEQVRATTQATERVKAEISGHLWENQNRWTLKRDLYVQLLQSLNDTGFAMRQLEFCDQRREDGEGSHYVELADEYTGRLVKGITDLRSAAAIAPLVPG